MNDIGNERIQEIAGEIGALGDREGLHKDAFPHFIKEILAHRIAVEQFFVTYIDKQARLELSHIKMLESDNKALQAVPRALAHQFSGQSGGNHLEIERCRQKLARLGDLADELGIETSLNRRSDAMLVQLFGLNMRT